MVGLRLVGGDGETYFLAGGFEVCRGVFTLGSKRTCRGWTFSVSRGERRGVDLGKERVTRTPALLT